MSPPDAISRARRFAIGSAVLCAVFASAKANATLPPWMQHIVGASTIESALYRVMQLPAAKISYPRPPKEASSELAQQISAHPDEAELYELKARAEEQALNPTAAEADWKLNVSHAHDPVAARLELADFYERRLMSAQEIATLTEVATAPPLASEEYLKPGDQRSWQAFERILGTIYRQNLPATQTASKFDAFLTRYPDQPAIYAADLRFQLDQQDWNATSSLIMRYEHQFPTDKIFPMRARALLELRRNNAAAALALYDTSFQPLWPAELVQSYFALLEQTHQQRAFVVAARERLTTHPDGPEALNAIARIFYYEQQAGRTDAAQQALDTFRIDRDARHGTWTAVDLDTLARLSSLVHSYSETARYDYALASTQGNLPDGEPAAQVGLAGLIEVLLDAPDRPLAIGTQNLTLYKDIATLDQGPGYWNGILSLWLNGEDPASEYRAENGKAQSYFHRSKAAELLAQLDQRFPNAPQRAALHAKLVHAIAQYGEPAVVLSEGKTYLAAFPSASERQDVATLMADAYARENDTVDEFSLYESQLNDLAAKTHGLPLTSSSTTPPTPSEPGSIDVTIGVQDPESVDANAGASRTIQAQPLAELPSRKSLPEGAAYAAVLDRYLGRLTSTGQLPRALAVLRTQLDHNPTDPLLYERLANFMQQNNLSAEQEQVYQQAIAKFQQPGLYDKLARAYLRERKREDFAALTRKVTDIFSGNDLDAFFANVNTAEPIGPQLALQLNLYAAKRFPHDLVFTRNLLIAYQAPVTRDNAAYESLLRNQWWTSTELRDEFVTYLSRTGKLQTELSQLEALHPTDTATNNPAALRELAELDIFTSHFEQATPLLGAVADLYPADADIGDRAISLYRSQAYLDPTTSSTSRAVALEKNLLSFTPDSPDRLATLGDLYAEATSTGGEDLATAAPFWHRIPELHPGSTQGFLTSSTIFWDYFQFDAALNDVTTARARFHAPSLFGYEAGAIEENRHNPAAAINEYTNAVIHPIEINQHFDSGFGTVEAWLKPPSDAADSNLRAAAQSFFGSEESHARLIQLASRAATRADVDMATNRAVKENPSNIAALALRADVLAAQHHEPEISAQLTGLFDQALERAGTLDEATAIGTLAQARNLITIYEHALSKETRLTPDPVQKLELQLSLAHSLESHEDIAAATRIVEAVHAANPRILGVVRSTTDFYLRNHQPGRAIATLLEAAKLANPSLARDFTLEAAVHANEADDTAQARSLALSLLSVTPYDARVLEIIATSYAPAHDDQGLKQFYFAQLDAAQKAPGLSADARKQNVALLRRGLIPALGRLNDFEGATDQYIALLSAFPEDSGLEQEAALYALQHNRQSQLIDFLNTTIKQSPRDSRFMILLARAQATFGDLPAAEAAYALAISIRKDRIDLYSAHAEIALQLSQSNPSELDHAAADFERLYVLSYHDPSWMVRLAELRARQSRPADAVKALQAAYLDGHTRSAADLFTVAAKLNQWNMLAEARTFADQGAAVAGSELLTPPSVSVYPEPELGAAIYARIYTRAGHADQALATLTRARKDADLSAVSPSVLVAELARQNISEDEAAAFRKNFAKQHREAADRNLRVAVIALGQAVQTYYTPEQKQTFATLLDALHETAKPGANPELALQVATASGLVDREAAWRKQRLIAGNLARADVQSYVALQSHRLQFDDLGSTLEAYSLRLRPKLRLPVQTQAAQAYRDAGDIANETRLDRSLVLGNVTQLRERLFYLLLHHSTDALLATAANKDAGLADAALNYIVAHGTEAQALAAVTRRGQSLEPIWTPASASLVHTYFAGPSTSPAALNDFNNALGIETTIAARLASPADPKQQLTGDLFFYYASRFGIYLATASGGNGPHRDAEDLLSAELERSPQAAQPYLELARTYIDLGHIDSAIVEYNHALELEPANASIEDELATNLVQANRREEALLHWHNALSILSAMQQHAEYPESWFTSLESVTRHLGQMHLISNVQPELNGIVASYLAKNGTYRSNEILKSLYQASDSPEVGIQNLFTVTNSAADPEEVLRELEGASWLGDESAEQLLLRLLQLERTHPQNASNSENLLLHDQLKLIDLYLAHNQIAKAQSLFDTLADKDSSSSAIDRVVLATRSHHLPALLDIWRSNPDSVPKEALDPALHALLTPTQSYKPEPAAVLPLQEFVFNYKRQNDSLTSTDFLALAQLRLDTADLPGALALLHQLTLFRDDNAGSATSAFNQEQPDEAALNPSNPADAAASLLEKNDHPAEALPFLQSLVSSTPWNAAYRLRLAKALLASNAREQALATLINIARDATASYDLRAQAATAISPLTPQATDLGSKELDLLTHRRTKEAVRQPYFFQARIAIATLSSTSPADRSLLLREAIAIQPSSYASDHARIDLLLLPSGSAASPSTLAVFDSIRGEVSNTNSSLPAEDSDATPVPDETLAPSHVPNSESSGDVPLVAATFPSFIETLDLPTRLRVALVVVSAYQRDGDLEQALAYTELALKLTKDAPPPDMLQRRDELKTQVLLTLRNRLRQPDLHESLGQPNQVRPRLTAATLHQETPR
jgi:cytochrome c-type biogenesis protein CcmH/NrfG